MDIEREVEEIGYEAEQLESLILAISSAIYNGAYDYKEYENGMNAIYNFAREHAKHMKKLIDAVFELKKNYDEETKKQVAPAQRKNSKTGG